MNRDLKAAASDPQQATSDHHVSTETPEQFGAWLRSDEAQRYIGCKTIHGWYQWRKRHALVTRGRLVARADIDRALKVMAKRKRQMAPASLANLRRRSA